MKVFDVPCARIVALDAEGNEVESRWTSDAVPGIDPGELVGSGSITVTVPPDALARALDEIG